MLSNGLHGRYCANNASAAESCWRRSEARSVDVVCLDGRAVGHPMDERALLCAAPCRPRPTQSARRFSPPHLPVHESGRAGPAAGKDRKAPNQTKDAPGLIWRREPADQPAGPTAMAAPRALAMPLDVSTALLFSRPDTGPQIVRPRRRVR
jgi:hypothetical protein